MREELVFVFIRVITKKECSRQNTPNCNGVEKIVLKVDKKCSAAAFHFAHCERWVFITWVEDMGSTAYYRRGMGTEDVGAGPHLWTRYERTSESGPI